MYSRQARRTNRPSPARLPVAAAIAGFTLLTIATLCAGSAAVASAANVTVAAPAWTLIDIGVENGAPGPYVLVAGQLPTTTPLPQAVQIAVPASSTPQWVGEVYPSNVASDTQLPYEVSRRGTMDLYSMTLKGSRLGQVEAIVPGLISQSGSTYVVSLNWVAPTPAGTCRIAFTLPPNARVVKAAEGAQTAADSQGVNHYYRVVENVKAGDTVSLNFTYEIPTTTGASTSSGTSIPLIWWIIGIGVVIALVLAVLVWRQNARAASEPFDPSRGSDE